MDFMCDVESRSVVIKGRSKDIDHFFRIIEEAEQFGEVKRADLTQMQFKISLCVDDDKIDALQTYTCLGFFGCEVEFLFRETCSP